MKQRLLNYILTTILILFCSLNVSAQISGVVTDSLTNEPIMYVIVQYEGEGVGTVTNADGEYEVEVLPGWNELTFSSIGYKTKKIKFKSGTKTINVKLQEDDIMLSEVTVNLLPHPKSVPIRSVNKIR